MRWVFTESRVEELLNCVASYTFLAFIYKKFKLGLPNWMCLCSSKFFPEQSSCFSPIPASEGGHAPAAKFKHLLGIINQFSVLEFSYRFQIPSRILRSSRLQRVQRCVAACMLRTQFLLFNDAFEDIATVTKNVTAVTSQCWQLVIC